jgi:hypothetical protein
MTGPPADAATAARRLVEAGESILHAAAGDVPELAHALLEAVGWATVDLDRANEAFDVADVAGAGAGWQSTPRDAHLGATARSRVTPLEPRGPTLILLEPDTEGRLAAALARHGERVAAIYVSGAAIATTATRSMLSDAADGPLGPARRLLGGQPDGPEILVLARPPEPS